MITVDNILKQLEGRITRGEAKNDPDPEIKGMIRGYKSIKQWIEQFR